MTAAHVSRQTIVRHVITKIKRPLRKSSKSALSITKNQVAFAVCAHIMSVDSKGNPQMPPLIYIPCFHPFLEQKMDSLYLTQSIKVKTHPVSSGLITNMEENINVLKIIKENMSANVQ